MFVKPFTPRERGAGEEKQHTFPRPIFDPTEQRKEESRSRPNRVIFISNSTSPHLHLPFIFVTDLRSQLAVLLLEVVDLAAQALSLLGRLDGELVDDLDESPQAEDHNQGGDLLDDAVLQQVDHEARDDDEGVEAVQLVFEVSVCCNALFR